MPYYLDNAFLLDNPWITVVDCGGTGGFVAEGLCRLLQGRQATIVLVDHDRVEPHNLLRQNFYPEDEGRFKSQALADRLAKAYRRPVGYSVYLFRDEDSRPDGRRYPGLPSYGNSLLIGCADNAAARRAMAESLPGDPRRWLIGAGNDTNWRQVLVGNVADEISWDEPASGYSTVVQAQSQSRSENASFRSKLSMLSLTLRIRHRSLPPFLTPRRPLPIIWKYRLGLYTGRATMMARVFGASNPSRNIP